jgi:hypothetical protein
MGSIAEEIAECRMPNAEWGEEMLRGWRLLGCGEGVFQDQDFFVSAGVGIVEACFYCSEDQSMLDVGG